MAYELALSQSLPNELEAALLKKRPLVVMVSLEGCPFCKIARENYLHPMWRANQISIVQIDMLGKQQTRLVDNQITTHGALVKTWQVTVAPTLLFFGKNLLELAERMEGGYLPDFYQAYLDDRLQKATRKLSVNAA